jgi:hypothetical protein
MAHQLTVGQGFVFGRSDWEYVFNTFSFGYAYGYHFISTPTGSCNGNFLGIGADLCTNASVVVDQGQPYGILITNGEFTAFIDKNFCPSCVGDPTHVVTNAGNGANVRFVNSAFWGPAHQIGMLYGDAVVGFSQCTFWQWDSDKSGRPALHVFGALARGSAVCVAAAVASALTQRPAQMNRRVACRARMSVPAADGASETRKGHQQGGHCWQHHERRRADHRPRSTRCPARSQRR